MQLKEIEKNDKLKESWEMNCIKIKVDTLAGVAQWIECWPAKQKVSGSIPSQGTCLSCGPGPQLGGGV